ncbi:MAG: response regulator [Croceibacterium sp.]
MVMPSSEWPPFAASTSSRRAILIVEDEILIRTLASDELRDAGFDVIEAVNGDEALAVLKSGVRVDLVFSDVRMPGSLDGVGLLGAVKVGFPEIPVILTSAHLEPTIAVTNGAVCFVAKPYPMNTVVAIIERELARTV